MFCFFVPIVVLLVALVIMYKRETESPSYRRAPVAKTIQFVIFMMFTVEIFAKVYGLVRAGYWVSLLGALIGLCVLRLAIRTLVYVITDCRDRSKMRQQLPYLK